MELYGQIKSCNLYCWLMGESCFPKGTNNKQSGQYLLKYFSLELQTDKGSGPKTKP